MAPDFKHLLFDHAKVVSRKLASIRENQIRKIEATGRKVTRIEHGPDGKETMVSELANYQSPPDDYERYDSLDALGYYAAAMKEHMEHMKTGIKGDRADTIDDPLEPKAITGPHMYSEDCHCERCAGFRAKQSAGMDIDIEMVRREVGLIQNDAEMDWMNNHCKGDKPDPLMRIPCSVVLALCEKADHYRPGSPYTAEFALQQQNDALRRELAELKDGTVTSDDLDDAIKAGASADTQAVDLLPRWWLDQVSTGVNSK